MTPPLDLMLAYALLGLAISIGWRFVIHRPLKDAAIVGIFWPLTIWFFVLVGFLWAVNAWARSITSVLPHRGSPEELKSSWLIGFDSIGPPDSSAKTAAEAKLQLPPRAFHEEES